MRRALPARAFVAALAAALAGAPISGAHPLAAEERGALALEPPRDLRLAFSGWVGERLEKNVDRWLLQAPEANPGMLEMFRVRDRKPAPSLVPWAGEFAGKYLVSAVLAVRATGRADLRDRVRAFVEELVATQAEDGYLGPFPRTERLLGNWDLWGHYHAIWGLLLYHELAEDRAAFEAALKAADLVAATYLDGTRRVIDAGSHEMNMAIVHALARLYRLSGKERYLRLVREIERDWESAGDYVRQGLAGVEFYETPRPRWESLHDIQGLAELYRVTGDERYRTALSNLWRSIRAKDRHNTGGFSTGEQAVGDPYAPGAIETCSTVAWVALSADQLRLTGDAAVADELELSTLNGILGAQHPSGRWWTYSTPMDGVREASAHAIVFQARAGTPELNCCSVHGPRGLAAVAEWAVLSKGSSVTLSYYGPLRASLELPSGTRLEIEEATSYPAGDGTVEIAVRPEREEEFALRLRIPEWSERTAVCVRGEAPRAARPGSHFVLERRWRPGDAVRLALDMRLRVLPGARAQAGKVSLYRGPLLLAYDQGLDEFDPDEIPPVDAKAVAGLSLPEARPPERGVRPFLVVEVPAAGGSKIRLCDFASAGAAGTRYRSWLPAVRAPGSADLPPEPRADGVLVSAPLRGDPKPSYGRLLDSRGVAPAQGPGGEPGGALATDGARGRVRYELPRFPGKDYAAAVRVCVRALPEGRIGQVLSAWVAPMDDPLRIVIDRGLLFARVEAGRAYSTAGVPVAPGAWIRVAAVKSGGRLSLYVDGLERASAEVPEEVRSAALDVALGGNPHFGGEEGLAASFRDFVLYARALSAEEVRALDAAPGGR